ncbi:type II secretion system protein [Undibacterium curvum]|uniref:type II secretion system protein n=1 Tax=Undibacterium curvum TaxID=2762294 RepID=UPI003D113832
MVNQSFLRTRDNGFTLIELLVVLAIVALLLTLASPRYFQSIETSKETVLLHNLHSTRETISHFYSDTGKYPETLEELVEKKYLHSIPIDPISELPWKIIPPEEEDKGKVFDVKSSSPGVAKNGIPFSEL